MLEVALGFSPAIRELEDRPDDGRRLDHRNEGLATARRPARDRGHDREPGGMAHRTEAVEGDGTIEDAPDDPRSNLDR